MSNKHARKLFKAQRKAHHLAHQHAREKTDGAGGQRIGGTTNICSAVHMSGATKHSKAIMTASGGEFVTGGLTQAQKDELRDTAPWASLVQALPNYPFNNCAEAKMWIELKTRDLDPGDFRITSMKSDGKVNPPCANCQLWVYQTFGDVVD
jgi:hypothetical protein